MENDDQDFELGDPLPLQNQNPASTGMNYGIFTTPALVPVTTASAEPYVENDPNKLNFQNLKSGVHVKFKCGCCGWIESVSGDSALSHERWFSYRMTYQKCGGAKSLETVYREDTGNGLMTVLGGMFANYLPAEPFEPPSWYPSPDKPPTLAKDSRAICVRIREFDASFMIPGSLVVGDLYMLSGVIRNIMANLPSMHTEVNVVDFSDHGDAKVAFKAFAKRKPMTLEEVNAEALYDWIIPMIKRGGPSSSIDAGHTPLSTSVVDGVLMRVKAHPLWNKNHVSVTTPERVVALTAEGFIAKENS